jgi:hypothetical protein
MRGTKFGLEVVIGQNSLDCICIQCGLSCEPQHLEEISNLELKNVDERLFDGDVKSLITKI